MATIIKQISVDVAAKNVLLSILAKQYDANSRFLNVRLTDEGKNINVTPDSFVTLNACREDNQSKAFSGVVNEDGTVTVPIAYWMLELDGQVKCDISVINSEQHKLTSTSFTISVEAAAYSGTEISEDDQYDPLVKLIAEVKTLEEDIETKLANGEFKGEKGEQGIQGIQGEKGDKGDKGDVSVEMLNDTIKPIKEAYSFDILSTATVVDARFVDSDTKAIVTSGSWKSYWIDVTNINEIICLKVWGTTYIAAYAIAFYSSTEPTAETFVGGQLFTSTDTTKPNVFENIVVPDNAVLAVISNRKATSEEGISVSGISYDINHYTEKSRIDNIEEELAVVKSETTVDLMIQENRYQTVNNGNCYASSTGAINGSGSWAGYVLPIGYGKYTVSCYTNDKDILVVAFYSSEELNADTLISGISFKSAGFEAQYNILTDITFTDKDIPEGTKTIFACSRTASGSGTAIIKTETLNDKVNALGGDIAEIKSEVFSSFGRGNVKAVYKNIPNSNDFTVIKDEIWFAENHYENGVATEYTTISRYKIIDGRLVFMSNIDSDFGHWNVVDYCEDNDCLIFGNAANEKTTEGNYFTVVKNPLALGSVARKAECGIKYPVDIGFKVQAVWGDHNFGRNNIVYLLSNNASKVTKVMLMRDADGNFVVDGAGNGQYVVLETKELPNVSIGVGGADFWGDTLYIGNGAYNYGLELMSMSDYSVKSIKRHCYNDDGTEYIGSTQGVHVDSDYIWVFVNATTPWGCYLTQYYR